MNKAALKIFTLLCLLYLSACSTSNSTKTFTPLTAGNDQVIVYIYRLPAITNAAYSPGLYINDEFKFAIKNGYKTHLTLSPGEYKVELEPDKNYTGTTRLLLNLNAGTTYYVRVDTSLKIKSAINYSLYERRFDLTTVDEKLAIKQIEKCCMTKNNKSAIHSETKSIKKEANESFSVDKTQNPFSR